MCGVGERERGRQRRRKGAHDVGICVVWGEGGREGGRKEGREGGKEGMRLRDADRARITAALLLYCFTAFAALLLYCCFAAAAALISATWAKK
jgi:hypothetical protein